MLLRFRDKSIIRVRYVYRYLEGAETGRVDIVFLWFEAVEAPYECKFEIAGHITHFHSVILSCMSDCHCRRPAVEYIVCLQVNFAATLLAELPFHTSVNFPQCG